MSKRFKRRRKESPYPTHVAIDFTKIEGLKHNPVIELTEADLMEINPDAIRISQSSIKTWRKCKREYYYKFVEGLERKHSPAPLYKGSIIHEILEARINGEDWRQVMEEHLLEYDKLFDEEKILYGDLRNDLPIIMEGYDKKYKDEDLVYFEKDGKRAEFAFSIPLDGKSIEETEIIFRGKIDAVAQDSQGRVWLMDHKTFSRIPDENFRFANQQVLLYAWAMPQAGFPKPDGMLWDYIRSKPPAIPHELKSGGLSKAKSIDTTPEVYLEKIHELGLDPADYEDILSKLEANEESFYRRIYTPIRESMIYPVVADLLETAKEIQALAGVSKARSLDRHCSYCSFRSLCQTELQGLDTEYILKAEYQPSTYHLVADARMDQEERAEEEN